MKKEIIDNIRKELMKTYIEDQLENHYFLKNNFLILKGGENKNEIQR